MQVQLFSARQADHHVIRFWESRLVRLKRSRMLTIMN